MTAAFTDEQSNDPLGYSLRTSVPTDKNVSFTVRLHNDINTLPSNIATFSKDTQYISNYTVILHTHMTLPEIKFKKRRKKRNVIICKNHSAP